MSHASPTDAIGRIAAGLRTALRLSGISHRACERELGLSVGYLTRILAGQVQLRVSIVLDICRMTGLPPAAFFTALFPDPQVSEPTARVLRGLAAMHRPHRSTQSAGASAFDGNPFSPASPPDRPLRSPRSDPPSGVSLDDVLLQLRNAVHMLETLAEPASAGEPGNARQGL